MESPMCSANTVRSRGRLLMRVAALLLMPALASCGTMLGPRSSAVDVATMPPGARVRYRGVTVGTTPCNIRVWRTDTVIELSLAGYYTQTADVGTCGNLAVILNVLIGGLPGLLIDAATGGAQVVNADPVLVRLTPDGMPEPDRWARPSDR